MHAVEVDFLEELALDLRWSWNHGADEVWRELDPLLWELTHNPWVILQTVSKNRLKELLNKSSFHQKLKDLIRSKRELESSRAWFQQTHHCATLNNYTNSTVI